MTEPYTPQFMVGVDAKGGGSIGRVVLLAPPTPYGNRSQRRQWAAQQKKAGE